VAYRFSLSVCAVAVACLSISIAWSGCSAQGEGERCTFFGNNANPSINGSDDCQSGLSCFPGSDFPNTDGTYDRCCPLDYQSLPSEQLVPACQVKKAPDAGIVEMSDGAFDVGVDSSQPDAGSDALSSDASDGAADGEASADASDTGPDSTSSDARATADAHADARSE